MDNNNPPVPLSPLIPQVSFEKKSGIKDLIKAFFIEGILLFFVFFGVFLFLNYFNVIPVSKNVSLLSFLPHQQKFENSINSMSSNSPSIIPSPTPFSHKIADVPDRTDMVPIFSPDKEKVVFETPEGHEGYIVPNCQVCSNMVIAIAAFSYKTNKLTLLGASLDKKVHIITDGKEIQTLANFGGITISKNGQKIATWNKENGFINYYINGNEVAKYPDTTDDTIISDISFSFDGARNGYILKSAIGKFSKVFIDGSEQKYPGEKLSFAPQGGNYAYIGSVGQNAFIVLNGTKQKDYLEIKETTGLSTFMSGERYVWSADGKRIAYIGNISRNTPEGGFGYDGESAIVVDGQEVVKSTEQVEQMSFSPNGERFAYLASNKKGNYDLVVDGTLIDTSPGYMHSSLKQFYFSPDSKRFFYTLNGFLYEYRHNSNPIKINNESGGIAGVVFSPDSQRYAFVIERKGSDNVVVDGKEYKGYGASRIPVFSPDSKHIAFWEGDATYEPIQGYGYVSNLGYKSTVVLDFVHKNQIVDSYGSLKENYYLASPSRASTYSYLQPNSFSTEIINSMTFSEDNKFMKFNAIRGKEYWVIVIDTTTGKEVVDQNIPIPTDLPISTAFPAPTSKHITPTP